MIKIIKSEKLSHPSTFQPEFRFECVLNISSEQLQDIESVKTIADAFYYKLGKKIYLELQTHLNGIDKAIDQAIANDKDK